MQRGYLWERLSDEIAEEFAEFGQAPRRGELVKAGFQIKRRIERLPPAPRQSRSVIGRRSYARAVASGQCVKGAHPARPGKRTCAACSSEATERNRRTRKARRAS